MDNEGVYRTGEAAARAGVSEPVLRMWERRYGLAPPARSSGGHRRYSESNVAVVRRAVELIAAGMTTDAAVTAARAEVEDPAQPSAGPRPLSEIRRRRDAAVLVRRHLVEEREALFAEREVIVHAFDTLTGRRRPPTAADGRRRRPTTSPAARPVIDLSPYESDSSR